MPKSLVLALWVLCLSLIASCEGIEYSPPQSDDVATIPSDSIGDVPTTRILEPLEDLTEALPQPAPEDAGAASAFDAEAEARAREEAAREAFEAEWPLHGVAFHFLAQVRARPDVTSPVVGYLRRGAHFRAKEPLRGTGCARGWSEVVGGGFVCKGEGVTLGRDPQTFEASPVSPALEDALPYPYAYVAREDAPQYWRVPTTREEQTAAEIMADLRARTASAIEAGEAVDPGLEAPPGLSEGSEVAAATLPNALPDFLRMRMLRGFYVSIDREEEFAGRRFFRTIRGTYVPADVLTEATPPTMRGVVLGGEWSAPIAFVWRRGTSTLVRDPITLALETSSTIELHTPLVLSDEIIERRGSRYRMSKSGVIVRESALRIVPTVARPQGISASDRWIHVDLSEQTLVAYEGDRAVFATLVSSGRPSFETPTGTFRIQSKHVSTTMDDPDSLTEAYSIEDVPWTMYFEGSYALHGAFWHDHFGHTRSHGCVNLAPADARWLFQWTTPSLPPAWHGVISVGRRVGTWVHITE